MSEVIARAEEARTLLDHPAFVAIMAEIQEDAVSAFLNPSATPADLEAAHAKVRAVEAVKAAIQSRLDAETIQNRKDQHRGSD